MAQSTVPGGLPPPNPFANLLLTTKSRQSRHASSRNIPEPPNPGSSGRQVGEQVAERGWRQARMDLHFLSFHVGII